MPESNGPCDLGALYDELQEDARNMIMDLNRMVSMYSTVGLFMVTFGIVFVAYALAGWYRLLTGNTGLTYYMLAIGGTIGGVIQLVAGPYLIQSYFRLRRRYPKLIPFPRILLFAGRPAKKMAAPDEEGRLRELQELYDELWKDIRSVIVDMNKSIKTYLLAGLMFVVYGIAFLLWGWGPILSGNVSGEAYFVTFFLTIGGLPMLGAGLFMVYLYVKLRTRYVRLIRLEGATED
ncbi:MAG: hypothetical protein WBZ29_15285 [Methanocella sp.]